MLRIVAVAAFLGLWQLSVAAGWVSDSAVSSPAQIVTAAGPALAGADYAYAVLDTVISWIEGLLSALLIAIPLGLVLGSNEWAYRTSRFTIDFLRTIPPVALIPLVLLIFGATPQMAFVLIVFGSLWVVLLQTIYGVHQVDPAARDTARAYRLRRRDRIRSLILPAAAPFIATGVRLATTMALLLAIGAELIGGAPGIGAQITVAQIANDIPQMWVYVVTSAALGVMANLALLGLERRVLKWHPAQRSAVAL